MRENCQKYTSHWMTNPLKTTEESCLKCHDESAETLKARVQTIGDNTFKLQRIAGQTVAQAHKTIKAAMDAGATDEQLAESRQLVREAQWYWDWVIAWASTTRTRSCARLVSPSIKHISALRRRTLS